MCSRRNSTHAYQQRAKTQNQNISMGAYWGYALAHNNMLEIFLF